MICLVVLSQGCRDRSTRLAQEDVPSPSKAILRDAVTFQIPQAEEVWGLGIVGNLPGTGSPFCPPNVRTQLLRMMSSSYTQDVNMDAFILSPNTAVVYLEGEIPGSAIKTDVFDIRVKPYDKRCSLAGGWLYRTDLALSQMVVGVMLNTVATAEGAIFSLSQPGLNNTEYRGLILGGGKVVAETTTHLILNEPGFKRASFIRNLVNNRFGFDTAQATSPSQVDVHVPLQYSKNRWRFWATVEALPMAGDQETRDDRIKALVQKLTARQDLDETEIALEAMGKACVPLLGPHLLHPDPGVRLAVARCLGSQGSSPGLGALAQIAENPQSPYRVQAMHALNPMTSIPQVSEFVGKLLGDIDFQFAMDVYESLCMEDGVGVERETVAGVFTLDLIPQNPTKAVLATRRGGAHLALFGAPILLKPGQIIEFPQKNMTLDTKYDGQSVVISRRSSPSDPAIASVNCSFQLRDVILVLCKKPRLGSSEAGFGMAYDEILSLIEQLSEQEMIPAKLWAGPLPNLP